LGDLKATYDDHLRLIEKRVGDFLLVLIELFSLGRTAEALRAITGSKSPISLQRGSVYPKFQVEGVDPHQPFCHNGWWDSASWKDRLNDLSYGMKITTYFSSVLSQCTRLTDGQTDGQTEFSSQDRVCILCSAVKMQRKKGTSAFLSCLKPACRSDRSCHLPVPALWPEFGCCCCV